MEKLKQQVAAARRRLVLQKFLSVLVWCWFATLLAAAVAIGVQKMWLVNVDGWLWAAGWLGGAVTLGLFSALAWVWFTRLPELEAAIEIDHRFGLKERISSSLALSAEELQTQSGQALVDDAQRRVSKLEVTQRFPIRLNRAAWMPMLPAILAFALCFLADPTMPTKADASANTTAITKQMSEAVKPTEKKLEALKEQANQEKMPELAELFKKIEEGTRDLQKKDNNGDPHEMLAKLNDLTQQLEHRREQLAEGEKLKEQLAGMKNLPSGPADKLAQNMKNGDFSKAAKELEQLKQQLSQGKLDPEKQKELANQLEAMKNAMEKMADAHEKKMDELQKQLDQAKKAGDQNAANNLQQQLQKMQQQQSQMAQMKEMASKMGQASQSMKEGNMQQAQAALNQMSDQLSQLQQEGSQLAMLDASLAELSECKNGMCECMSNLDGDGKKGSKGFADKGRARGAEGERPENANPTKLYDTKVKQEVGKGNSVVTGLVEGPNAKGQVAEEIKTQVEAAKHGAADPLTGQRLPRSQREHVEQYFDAFLPQRQK